MPERPTGQPRTLDRLDRRILDALQRDGRMSNRDLAAAVNLSPTPCLRRTARLEEGPIRRYKAILDPKALGYSIRAFLSLKRSRDSEREEIAALILAVPEVVACHVVSGEYDLIVEIVARDMDDYARIALDTIAAMPGIHDLRTTFSLVALRTDGDLPVDVSPDPQSR